MCAGGRKLSWVCIQHLHFLPNVKAKWDVETQWEMLPLRYQRSYQRMGDSLFLGNTAHHAAPQSWGTWFCFIPGKSPPHVFPVYDQPMPSCFLSGVLAVDSFSSWPSMGPACFPSHFCLLLRASKICFPTQDQWAHLENIFLWQGDLQTGSLRLWHSGRSSPTTSLLGAEQNNWGIPLFHGGSKCDEKGRRNILKEAAGVSCRWFNF